MFWTLHQIGYLSPHHLAFFLEFESILSFGPDFFVLAHLWLCKGKSCRYLPGWGNSCHCLVGLYVGEGSEREHWYLFGSRPVFSHFPHYPQVNWAFSCWFPAGWVCVHSRTLWVSPVNSPARLGVSPTTTTPIGFFSQRFWSFISLRWNPGLCVLSCSPVVPPGLSACKCGTTQSTSYHLVISPLHPGCPSPPLLRFEWMFLL